MKKCIALILAAALTAALPLSVLADSAGSDGNAAYAEASGEAESALPALIEEAAADDDALSDEAAAGEDALSNEAAAGEDALINEAADDPMLIETAGVRSGDWVYEKAEGSATLTEYYGESKDVVIPSKIDGYTVTSLGDNLFNENDSITSVVISDSVINIGAYSFYECIGLKSIKFGANVAYIDEYAFFGCTGITEIALPESLETIGSYAFQGMTGLTSVNIPKNVIELGFNAFADTEQLQEIKFNAPNCVTEGNVFNRAGAKSGSLTFTIGKGVIDVPENLCFSDDDLNPPCITSLVIPNSVKTISEYAFYNCDMITDITWSTNLELIDEFAFSGCNALKKIIFPKGLKRIEMSAFSSCSSLEDISFQSGVVNVGYAFDYCENIKKVYVYGKKTNIVHEQFDWSKPDVKIFCHKDSPADTMAQDCGYNFEYFERDSYFPDVPPGHNYGKDIYWAVDAGIAAGYNNGLFGVSDNITRGQVVMFLWRLAGKPEPKKNTQTFTDVPTDHSYYKAIQWASEKKITAGYKDKSFGVKDNCTRGQIVTFLWRYKGKPAPSSTKPIFTDVPKTHNYFSPIMWAYGKKITAGYTDGTFKPKALCTRGQCARFLYRMEH